MSLYTHTTASCSWLFFCISCLLFPPESLRAIQQNAGGVRAKSTELLHFISSHPVDFICVQESNLISFFSFPIPGFSALRSDRTHSRSGILSPDATHASGGVINFVWQGFSFSELSTSSLSLLDPYSDYVWVNISLNNSSLLSFLNAYAYAPPIRSSPTDSKTDSFFSLHRPLLQKSLHSGGLQLSSAPIGLKRYFRSSGKGRKFSIGPSFLTSFPSITLTYLLFFIVPLAVAPSQISPLLPPLSFCLAHRRCFRAWVLIA